MNILDCFVFFLAIAILITSGSLRLKSVKSEEDYLFASRKSSFFALTCTLVMTEFNTSTLISFSGLGYLAGVRSLLMPAIFLIGLLFYTLVVSKKWRESNASSVSEIFSKKYSKTLGRVASIFLLLAMCGFNATYIKSLALLFAPMLPNISTHVIAIVFTILTLLMTLRGGLLAIIRTDILSFCLLVITVPLVCLITYFKVKAGAADVFTVENYQASAQLLPLKFVLSLVILTMFTYILAPWYAQKIFSAKNKKIAFFSCLTASFLVFILYGLCTLSTIYIKNSPMSHHEISYPFIIKHLMPSGLRGLCYSVLFAAAATTLAGAFSAMSSMVINDFFTLRKEAPIYRGIYLTALFAAIACFLSISLVDNILNKLILSNIPVFALSYALIAAFYSRKATALGAYVSIFVGLTWGVFCFLYFGEAGLYTWKWSTWGLLLTFGSGHLTSLVSYRKKSSSIMQS
ncbi:MAG: hypothetical protein S4CHLAM37_07100 [Chlamydiia bacterium]|nr:hypothetical protein [Chlamydiia bacterium]